MIELRNSQKSLNVEESSVIALCCFVLEKTGLPRCDLSVSLVDDDEIISLNQRYFHKSRPTDVISFPMEEQISDGSLLGDVVICTEQAIRFAGESGLPVEEEISLYLIHGILHLTGERDDTAGDRRSMEKKQQELLDIARKKGKIIAVSP